MNKLVLALLSLNLYGNNLQNDIQEFRKKVKNVSFFLLFKDEKSISVCNKLKEEGETLFKKIENNDIENKKALANILESLYTRNSTPLLNTNNACVENLVSAFYYKKFDAEDLELAIIYAQGDYNQNIDYKKAYGYIKEEEIAYNKNKDNKTLYFSASKIVYTLPVLAQFYEFGIGTNQDISKAISYYKTFFDDDKYKNTGQWKYAGFRLVSYYAKIGDKSKALEILNKVSSEKFNNIVYIMENNTPTQYSKYLPELKNYPKSEYLTTDFINGITIDISNLVKIYKIQYELY